MRVRSMMHTPIITVTPEMSLAEAQRLMRDHHIRHVPVDRALAISAWSAC